MPIDVRSDTRLPDVLLDALRRAERVVVFTGAGVSAESRIPTFRDALTGLWARFDAAALATPEAFERDPELVWGWYEWRRMKVREAQPNPAHRTIAELASRVPALTLVTQNVDDLHERAGSGEVVHLHGSIAAPRCFVCAAPHVLPSGAPSEPESGRRLVPPECQACGGPVRPGVVWFGEALPEQALQQAFDAAAACDLLLSVGTSGVVQPAALIPGLAKRAGATVVEINPQPTAQSGTYDWSLCGLAGVALPLLLQQAFGN